MSKKGAKKEEKPLKTQPDGGRRNFLKYAGAGVVGAAIGAVVEYPFLNSQIQADNSQISTLNGQVTQLNSQVSNLENEIATISGVYSLNPAEAILLESVAETMIPSDSTGPGAKEAGVIYFIDRQLGGDYGGSGRMYMNGPFLLPSQPGPITVQGITYSGGTAASRIEAAPGYQYGFDLREYWRRGLQWLQEYSNTVGGSNFENLSETMRTQILQDLWNNKPINFSGPSPIEFFTEVYEMIFAGFLMDPLHGGNRNMVGWKLVGFTGTNQGNAYNEGYNVKQLMVMDHPVRLQPQSLAQLQGGT